MLTPPPAMRITPPVASTAPPAFIGDRSPFARIRGRGFGALLALAAGACATGSTLRSGVGDALLDHPPYYAGMRAAAETVRVGHLPVTYQRWATQEVMFDPKGGAGTPVAALLAEMNAYLDSLGASARLVASATPPGTAPDVRFSCETDAVGDCVVGGGALGRGGRPMRLSVGRPSDDWVEATRGALDAAGAVRAVVITLEVGQYLPVQKGLRGDKEVELGTNHTVALPGSPRSRRR